MEWKHSLLTSLGRRTMGLAAITAAVFLLSLSDGLVKAMGDRLGLAQIVFVRSAFAALVLMVALTVFRVSGGWRRTHSPWAWARSLCLTGMWLCYYASLPSLSFALAAACYYTSPVWMALLSRFLLGEPLGAKRWAAILFSFAGVVVAVNPAVETLSPVVLLPLLAAFFYALSAIITWSRCQEEEPAMLAFNLNITLAAAGGAGLVGLALFAPPTPTDSFVLAVWPALAPRDWVLLAALGVLLALIATMVAQAYRLAPSPLVGVFDNAYLLFAALWGVLLFGEVPTMREGIGMAMIATGAVAMALSTGPPAKPSRQEGRALQSCRAPSETRQ